MKMLMWFGGIVVLFALIIGIEILHFGNLATSQNPNTPLPVLTLDGTSLGVLLATTPAAQALGLGNRPSLPQSEGMLFVFPESGVYPFWMKDMHFSLDIMWIASNGAIVGIFPNLSPATYPQSFAPQTPAQYVLEVNAGWAAAHHVQIGDIATLP